MKKTRIFPKRTLIGLIIMTIGTLYLLENLHMVTWPLTQYLFSWPTAMMLFGVLIVNKNWQSLFGYGLMIFGAMLFAKTFFGLFPFSFAIIWPALLILLGLRFIAHKGKDRRVHFEREFCRKSEKTHYTTPLI